MTDVVSFGPDKPPWRPSRRLVVAGTVLLAVIAAAALAVTSRDDPGSPAVLPSEAPSPSCRVTPEPAASSPKAVIIRGACTTGSGLVRLDPIVDLGPWTVVVRRRDGAFGRGGAVVTFPLRQRPVAAKGVISREVAGRYIRVRGDLTTPQLTAIANATTVSKGKPVVRAPSGYAVVATGTYRSGTVNEVRYGTADLGEQDALGNGLTFTGVALGGGGIEDQIYASGGLRRTTSIFGGNGAIAWEPSPGVVAFIGYSGASLDDEAAAALERLSTRATIIDAKGFALFNSQIVQQTNVPD